jgi:hypothetical protein
MRLDLHKAARPGQGNGVALALFDAVSPRLEARTYRQGVDQANWIARCACL